MTPEEYNELYSKSFNKNMRITIEDTDVVITNPDICSESMSIQDSLNSEQNLRFGSCESSCFKIRVTNNDISYKGKWLDVYANYNHNYWINSNNDYMVSSDGVRFVFTVNGKKYDTDHYGRFKVFSDRPTNDRSWRDLICYDAMYDILNADVLTWYSGLTFPMTIKDLRDSFFTYLGITQVDATLINDSYETQGGFVAEGKLSGKTIINAICEINAVFGHIRPDGKFDYIGVPNGDEVKLNWYIDGSGTYEDYVTEKITGVIARGSEDDVGTTVGTSVNPYIMENNPLIFGTEGTAELTGALTNILNAIKDITYRPYNIKTYGNPMLRLGTAIEIETRDKTIHSLVINKTMNGIQAMTDTLSASGDDYMPNNVNGIQTEISRTKGKIHDLQINVDTFRSEISDINKGSGRIYDCTSTTDYTVEIEGTSNTETRTKLNVPIADGTFFGLNNGDTVNVGIRNVTGADINTTYPKDLNLQIANNGTTETILVPIYYESGSELVGQIFIEDSYILYVTLSKDSLGNYACECQRVANTVSLFDQLANQIVLKVDSNGKIVNVALSADPTGSSFKVKADNIEFISNGKMELTTNNLEINSTYFKVSATGAITATSGTIGGWTINDGKIFGGDTTTGGVACMQLPSNNSVFVFAAGGTTHDSYLDCPFRVDKYGSLWATDATLEGSMTSISGDEKTKIDGGRIQLSYNNVDSVLIAPYLYNGNSSNKGAVITVQQKFFGLGWGTSSSSTAALIINNGLNPTSGASPMSQKLLFMTEAGTRSPIVFYNDDSSNDLGRIALLSGGANDGRMEIATADDGNEPIFVSQYSGSFTTLVRRAYLLDSAGNSNFPNHLYAGKNIYAGNTSATENRVTVLAPGGSNSEGFYLFCTDDGRFGIYDNDSSGNSTGALIARTSSANVQINPNFYSSSDVHIYGSTITVHGTFVNSSSKKIKKNVEEVTEKEADKILQLTPVKFDYNYSKSDKQENRGFIAEDVAKILPNLVVPESGDSKSDDYSPASIKYIDMIPYMVKVIQRLQKEINELKGGTK